MYCESRKKLFFTAFDCCFAFPLNYLLYIILYYIILYYIYKHCFKTQGKHCAFIMNTDSFIMDDIVDSVDSYWILLTAGPSSGGLRAVSRSH
jgi:hypothetical protein